MVTENPYPLIVAVGATGFIAGAAAELRRVVPRSKESSEILKQLWFGMFRSRREEYSPVGWRLVLIQRASYLLLWFLILFFFVTSVVSAR